ncbi:thioredoxin family protein [Pedobacter nutrimenti]|uniref:TlpA family protein disulfide reductase n=1 Tax=Pedobacter nutrimenti TaxID=1241337 RepID=UPI002931B58F|nr:thioredoxin family protein [Pedobacter nutrimenti]
MKKAIIYTKVILLIIICCNTCIAQIQNTIKFSGRIKDLVKKDIYQEVVVDYNSDNGFDPTGHHSSTFTINNSGYFQFELPDLNKPYKISMSIYNNDGTKLLWSNSYYTEPKDNIYMQIVIDESADSIVCTGIGMNKYNLAQKLNKQYFNDYYTELNLTTKIDNNGSMIFTNPDELTRRLKRLVRLVKKFESKKQELIRHTKITNQIRTILSYEFASYYDDWRLRIGILYANNKNYSTQIISNYLHYKNLFFNDPNPIAELCPKYLSKLSSRLILELKMNSKSDKVKINSLYDTIKNNYTGSIRDRLIGECIFSNVVFHDLESSSENYRDSIYKKALRDVSIPYVKRAIENKINELSKISGKSSLIESKFYALDGSKFDLKTLKGKIILIDTWFLGCRGCAMFHEDFEKEIYPKIREYKNFVLLSINIDDKAESWKKGLESNLYTSINNTNIINVNTGSGIGLSHPFLKYYSVSGAPYLMLVNSNGEIYYQPRIFDKSELINKINELIDQKQYSYSSK